MKKLVFALPFVLLFASRVDAACFDVPNPPRGTVCGHIVTTAGTAPTNGPYNVKFCPPGNPWYCRGTNTYMTRDAIGNPVMAFIIYNFGGTTSSYEEYDVFVWSDYAYYGSSTVPINREWISGYGISGLRYHAIPRPLPPTPVYPSHGSTNVPNTNLTVVWDSGIDAERSNFPATWAIYYKYWESWQTEPAGWTLARDNMPCHDDGSGPDAQGRCSTLVAGPQPLGNWKWKVVATLNVSSWVPAYMGPTYFDTESGAAQFTH